MGKLPEEHIDAEIKENRTGVKILTLILHMMPVMESIDRLGEAVRNKQKLWTKAKYDLRYIKHETELLEMNQRVYESLMKKNNLNT